MKILHILENIESCDECIYCQYNENYYCAHPDIDLDMIKDTNKILDNCPLPDTIEESNKKQPLDYKKMFMEVFKQQIKSGVKGKYSGAVLDEARKFLKESKK